MRRFRPFTWVILAVNALFAVWVLTGIIGAATGPPECPPSLSAEACSASTTIGAGIGVALLIALWLAVDLILGLLWLITRPRAQRDPAAG